MQITQLIERFGAVDGGAQVRAVVQTLGVPGTKGPDLVDHPSFVALAAATRVLRDRPRMSGSAPGAECRKPTGSCTRSFSSNSTYSSRKRPRSAGVTVRGARPAQRSAACARIHGFRRTPRPTSTPSTPACIRSMIWPGSTQSPLPNTGIFESGGDGRHQLPVGKPAVALRRSPSMNRHGGGPRIFHHLGQRRRVLLGFVPAGSHLDGHRDFHRLRHRLDHRGGLSGFAHQAASRVVLRDLRHGTTHVDVHDVSAHTLDDLCGGGHLRGVPAEDLNGDRPFFLRVFGVLERPVDAAHQPLRAHHLSHDQTASAVTLHEATECRVGHAGHRGNGEGRRKLN